MRECPKCQGRVSEGFIIDQGHGTYSVSTWQKGVAQKSIWTGVKRDKSNQLQIVTYRCDRCGYLENYAPAT
jgi:hypothetical protein